MTRAGYGTVAARRCIAVCAAGSTMWLMSALASAQQAAAGERGGSTRGLLFHVPFDGNCIPSVAAGAADPDGADTARFVPGKFGQAVDADAALQLSYAAAGNLDKHRGTVCMWVRPTWDGNDGKNHGFIADDINFGEIEENNILFWKWSVGTLRFDQRRDARSYLNVAVETWRAGEWRHLGAAWDVERGAWLFIDGEQVARREFSWQVKPGRRLLIGTNWCRSMPADCAIDDLRVYDRPLSAAQMRAVMAAQELVPITYHGVTVPERVQVGQPFRASVTVSSTRDVTWDRPVVASIDGLELGRFTAPDAVRLQAGIPTAIGPFDLTIPLHLYCAPGRHDLSFELCASLGEDTAAGSAHVVVERSAEVASSRISVADDGTVTRGGRPFLTDEVGVWYDGEFLQNDEQGRRTLAALARSGRIIDALRCRWVDQVDCTTTDHGFREFGSSRVAELAPGRRFRLTGPQESVQETRMVYKHERPLLPTFCYEMRVAPRPTPHLLVVESINDAERYLEVAVDVAPGSQPAPHLRQSGTGRTALINLGVAYTGREQGVDGRVFREYFLFFPKSDAIRVSVCHSRREATAPSEPGTPVSHLWVYEATDSLDSLANAVRVPIGAAARHVGLFYPQCQIMFDEYGFSGTGAAERCASVQVLSEYLRFMGFDRLEFHPYAFATRAYFASKLVEHSGQTDVFEDVLPITQDMGIQVVPRIDSLVFFDKFWEDDPADYQQKKDGTVHDYFGKVPDPLRPRVQQTLYDVLREMLEATKGYSNVPGVGFRANAKFGSLYVGSSPSAPPQETGLTPWHLQQFEKDTGIRVAVDHADPSAAYEWLRAECWERWIDWRCRRMHRWWTQARDIVRAAAPAKTLFVKTIIPYDHHFPSAETQGYGRGIDPLTEHRNHGYDPSLYVDEPGMLISRYINLDADRYNGGRVHNYAYWHDPRVPGLYRTREGTAVELYYIYWELATHPYGFRVGPEWPVGRGWMEPLTHALRTMNVYDITFYNWHRATTGRELGLREFCRAFRSLPAVAPTPFEGMVEPKPDEHLWIRWFDKRLALVNDSRADISLRLTLPANVRCPGTLLELATNTRPKVDQAARTITMPLRAFDLRVLDFDEQ